MNKLNQKKLLLVEDNIIIATTQSQQLQNYGYDVLQAITAKEAIKVIQIDSDIDLILMDIDLGEGMDGTQVAEIILKDKDIPLIFLSSHTDKETVQKTEKITSYGYVVKNSNLTVLDTAIKMAFRLFDAKQKTKIVEEELRTHQIELEMQNNEFRSKQIELEALREKYFNVYHYSPISQLTLNEKGVILEANLKAGSLLGIQRNKLTKQNFSDFIVNQDQDKYYLYRKNIELSTQNTSSNFCELRISKVNGTIVPIYLTSSNLLDSIDIYGEPFYQIAIIGNY